DFLGQGHQAVQSHLGHGFLRGLHGPGIQLDPTGIGQLDESACRHLQSLQIRYAELHPFLLPLRGDREPVDAAAFDDEPRPQWAWRQEKPVKSWISKVFSLAWALGPNPGQRAEESFICVTDPQARFRRKPVELAQPQRSRLQTRIVQKLGLVRWSPFGFAGL